MTKNIGVIGVGRLGLSFALLCAKKGYAVYGSDVNREYIESLQNKTHRTVEPLVEQWLQECNTFYPVYDNETVVENCSIIFLFVPTPSLSTGEYDHQYIEQVMGQCDMTGKTVVIGCTVMPGYTQSLIDRTGYTVAYNPEFIAQGDIIRGLYNADMVLVGAHEESAVHALQGIYRTIMDKVPVMNIMSPTAAELTKISINCFLTTKIAYANMIGEIAINSGVEKEIDSILSAIGSDSRIGNKYLKYGFGYGGVCLPRDNKALIVHSRNVGSMSRIAEGTEAANYLHHSFLRDYVINNRQNKEHPFIFSQLSYKKGVDILTESQQYKLCKELLMRGYNVVINESEIVCDAVRKELSTYIDQITFNQDTPGYKIEI